MTRVRRSLTPEATAFINQFFHSACTHDPCPLYEVTDITAGCLVALQVRKLRRFSLNKNKVTCTAALRRRSILGCNNTRISKNKTRRLEGYVRFNMEKINSAVAALEPISSLSGVQRG